MVEAEAEAEAGPAAIELMSLLPLKLIGKSKDNTSRQVNRQANRQADRQIGKQIDRQVERTN